MAWPRCPVCRRRHHRRWRLLLVDRVVAFFGIDVEVNRSYRCACGAKWLTVEALTSVNPPTPRLRGKYELCQPADSTPLPAELLSATLDSFPASGTQPKKGPKC